MLISIYKNPRDTQFRLRFSLDLVESEMFGQGQHHGTKVYVGGIWPNLIYFGRVPCERMITFPVTLSKLHKNSNRLITSIVASKLQNAPTQMFKGKNYPLYGHDSHVDVEQGFLLVGEYQAIQHYLQGQNSLAVQNSTAMVQPTVEPVKSTSGTNTLESTTTCVKKLKKLLADNPNLKLCTASGERLRDFDLVIE